MVKFKKAVIGIASERLAAAGCLCSSDAVERCPTTFWLPKNPDRGNHAGAAARPLESSIWRGTEAYTITIDRAKI